MHENELWVHGESPSWRGIVEVCLNGQSRRPPLWGCSAYVRKSQQEDDEGLSGPPLSDQSLENLPQAFDLIDCVVVNSSHTHHASVFFQP